MACDYSIFILSISFMESRVWIFSSIQRIIKRHIYETKLINLITSGTSFSYTYKPNYIILCNFASLRVANDNSI